MRRGYICLPHCSLSASHLIRFPAGLALCACVDRTNEMDWMPLQRQISANMCADRPPLFLILMRMV